MNTAGKGRRCEAKSRRWLQSKGYVCVRSAASKGLFDLVAISADHVLLVQVKSGRCPSAVELEVMKAVSAPPAVRKLAHRWRARRPEPDIKKL